MDQHRIDDPRAYARYGVWAAVASLLLMLVAGAINLIVDPYGIHRIVSIDGFNALKPVADRNVSLLKAYQVRTVEPDAILLGNSRVEMGFDADLFSDHFGQTIYNSAIPGATIYEQWRYLENAVALGSVDHVVVAIDFLAFNTERPRVNPTFVDGRLQQSTPDELSRLAIRETAQDIIDVYFSLYGLQASLETVLRQDDPRASTRTPLGFNPVVESPYFWDRLGYGVIFEDKTWSMLQRLHRRDFSFAPTDVWPEGSLTYLERILALCRREGIRLELFTHPYHAWMLESFHMAGLWPAFEDWKRAVVALVAADDVLNGSLPAVPVWDFATYNPITEEAVPEIGDLETVPVYHWEQSHYKASVGTEIVRRMYGLGDVPAGFGQQITLETLEDVLAAQVAAREAYRAARADEMARLQVMADRLDPDDAGTRP